MVPLIMVAAVCASVPGLIPSQLKQCQANPNAMFAVSEGTRRGLNECQLQFTNERWNCTPDGIIHHKSSSLVDQLYHHQPHPHPNSIGHFNSNSNSNYISNNNNQLISSNVIHNSNLPASNSIQSRNSLHAHHTHLNSITSTSLTPSSSSSSSSLPTASQMVPGHTISTSLDQLNSSNFSSKHQLLVYPIFNETLKHESRETAFLYAITSAGVVHAVTEACASGNLTECSCDRSRSSMPMNLHTSPSPSPLPSAPFTSPLATSASSSSSSPSLSPSTSGDGWKWGGCSDNVRYGMVFAKSFLDAPDRRLAKSTGELKYLMNLHNNHVGRLAVSSHMELRCRCHGISGSCELKTCWRTLPSFTIVGKYLKEKYETAVQVSEMLNVKKKISRNNHVNINNNVHPGGHGLITSPSSPSPSSPSSSSSRRRSRFKKYTLTNVHREDLVYIKKSPNYCIEDRKNGIYGTSGRICSKTSDGPDSCQLLCCGRGYNTKIKKVTTRCNCKFEWCCNVQCEICDTETEVYTCK